jgi:N-carbamoyl-L-amino-acid hydrolase
MIPVEQVRQAVLAQQPFVTRLFDELRARSVTGRGVTRDAYGTGEQSAHDLMSREAAAMGLRTTTDAALNTYMTLAGRSAHAPAIIIGSHLDSVANGGNFDGAAGVVAGMAVVAAIQQLGYRPENSITVMGVRAEESVWFPVSYIGSRAALGILPDGALDVPRTDTGRTLRDHIGSAGGDPAALANHVAHLTPAAVRAYFEVHIEQAPSLDAAATPIAVATAIPGNFRYPEARVLGDYGHVGLPRRFRQDATVALADLVMALDGLWARWDAAGREMSFNVGRVHTDPKQDALTKVAGEVRFTLDVRSYAEGDVAELFEEFSAIVAKIERTRNVSFQLGRKTTAEVALMAPQLRERLADSADSLRVPYLAIGSPGSHDAAAFASVGIPTGLLLVRNQNGSHNPDEAMRIEDFMQAVCVLTHSLVTLG